MVSSKLLTKVMDFKSLYGLTLIFVGFFFFKLIFFFQFRPLTFDLLEIGLWVVFFFNFLFIGLFEFYVRDRKVNQIFFLLVCLLSLYFVFILFKLIEFIKLSRVWLKSYIFIFFFYKQLRHLNKKILI